MFAPGPAFSDSDDSRGCLRFNVSRCSDPRVYEVLDEAIAAAPRRESALRRMPRFKLILEYDGAPFVGWQRQENGLSVSGSSGRAPSSR